MDLNNSYQFIHISDLHLGESLNPSERINGFPNSDEIKQKCLDQICQEISIRKPDFLFISGDLTEASQKHPKSNILSKAKEMLADIESGCKKTATEIIGISGEHDPLPEILREYFPWVKNYGEILRIKELSIGCLGVRNNRNGLARDLAKFEGKRLPIILFHSDQKSTSLFQKYGCIYLARGHDHRYRNFSTKGIKSFSPGHIYSYWDGCGKAWPTFYLTGTIENNACDIKRNLFNVPRTLRFYWHENENNIVLEGLLEREIHPHFTGWNIINEGYRYVVKKIGSTKTLPSLFENILNMFPKDIFVTPSYKHKRHVKYAKELLANKIIFDDFIKNCIRAGNAQ